MLTVVAIYTEGDGSSTEKSDAESDSTVRTAYMVPMIPHHSLDIVPIRRVRQLPILVMAIQIETAPKLLVTLEDISINPDLTPEHRGKLVKLLARYSNIFAKQFEDLEGTDVVTHATELNNDARPVYCPGMKRWAPTELEFFKENLDNELRSGVIVEMNGPLCAHVVLAKNESGAFRKCVTYIGLNKHTKRE